MIIWDISFMIYLLTLKWVKTEMFSATADLIPLIETHGHVIKSIQYYLEQEEKKLEVLRKRLTMFKREHKKMVPQEHYVGNPINAFKLIHSLTEELGVVEYYSRLEQYLQRASVRLPVKEDWEGAATALWRLQYTYNLNLTLLAAGKIRGKYSHGKKLYEEESSPMSTSALFAVGRVVYGAGDYKMALQWFHEALRNYYRRDLEDPFSYDDGPIIDYIRHAYHKVGDFNNAITWTEKLILKMQPLESQLRNSVALYRKELDKKLTAPYNISVSPLVNHGTSSEIAHLYPTLCRGEVSMPEQKRKDLHCHYKNGPSPFLKLAPIKSELLNSEPEVLLLYDTISDAEIQYLQDKSQNLLKRATANQQSVGYRISKSAWLWDSDSPVVARISRRVADFTSLNTATAEPLQIANYGIGGHYDPHFDFFRKSISREQKDGNRFATVMFYMSDVEQGGATVFTELQLTVFPMKNAAIFWYNLLPSGEPDFRTKHAACPVLRGSKWVSNKWLHEVGQGFLRSCNLEYQDNSYIAGEEAAYHLS